MISGDRIVFVFAHIYAYLVLLHPFLLHLRLPLKLNVSLLIHALFRGSARSKRIVRLLFTMRAGEVFMVISRYGIVLVFAHIDAYLV